MSSTIESPTDGPSWWVGKLTALEVEYSGRRGSYHAHYFGDGKHATATGSGYGSTPDAAKKAAKARAEAPNG